MSYASIKEGLAMQLPVADGNRLLRIVVISTAAFFLVAGLLLATPAFRAAIAGSGVYGDHAPFDSDQRCDQCHRAWHRAPLLGPCENCHTTRTWHSVDHKHKILGMDAGVHAKTACVACHARGGKPAGTRCDDCHRTSKHVFTPTCENCHTPSNWDYSREEPKRHVRLLGSHGPVACLDCHSLLRVPVVYRCTECHPSHARALPLERGHKIECTKCHNQDDGDNLNVAAVKASDCNACHPTKHSGLSQCGDCHTDAAWKPSTFRHEAAYPLRGAHARAKCLACHPGSQWGSARGSSCSSCHEPEHTGLLLCERCHSDGSVKADKFSHNEVLSLQGEHARVRCEQCHPKSDWGVVRGRTCRACHGAQHQTQLRCDSCHTPRGWAPIKRFAHPASYPLEGMHVYVPCGSCHKGLVFPGAFRKCVDCHAKLSHGHPDCERCHTPKGWEISGHE